MTLTESREILDGVLWI